MKFFEPTVSWTALLSGFSSIRFESALSLPLSPPSPESSSSEPQAAIPVAINAATISANSIRSRKWLVVIS